MPKALYLIHFQNNLRDSIEALVKDWGFDLQVNTEDNDLKGVFKSFIDISIKDPNNPNSLIAIEIEYKSCYEQAKKNIKKLKTWTHNSQNRRTGLLQIFNTDCYLSEGNLDDLVDFAKHSERKDHGFYYDFIHFTVPNQRATRQTPANMIESRDFKARLYMLMKDAGLV